jgi:hypothetical protein
MTTTAEYMAGRKKWSRPQAMVWCDEAPSIDENGNFIPVGYELGSDTTGFSEEDLQTSFIILSDHNRSQIGITNQRIEQRQRMANGTMRSFFIADKLSIETSWSMLPSRSFKDYPNFNNENTSTNLEVDSSGKPQLFAKTYANPEGAEVPAVPSGSKFYPQEQYTADGGAGGGEMLEWYENHTGPFWVLLSYDKYANFGKDVDGTDNAARQNLGQYSEARQMYISNFNYSIVKRGGNNFDMWDVSVTLEEV